MSTKLTNLLEADASAIADELALELRRSDTPSYRRVDAASLTERCRRLVESFIESSAGDPRPFQDYVRELTQRRISEGYALAELQRALVLLEQRAWQLAVEGSNLHDVLRHLSIITTTIGQAKDELARIFLARQQRAETALASLGVDGLFGGTDAHVEPGEAPAPDRHA